MDMNDVAKTFDLSPPYAVVAVVLRGSRVLLCQGPPSGWDRELMPAQGLIGAHHRPLADKRTWCLPGGKVEPTDLTPHDAAAREFGEECGLGHGLVMDWEQPFCYACTHDGRPMWAYVGMINNRVPDAWLGPEGRCAFVEMRQAPWRYRKDWLIAFCAVMRALPPGYLRDLGPFFWHVEHCLKCQAEQRPCEVCP